VSLKTDNINGTLHEDLRTFTISRWILLRIRNILDKICIENLKTLFMFNNVFRKSCYLWDNVKKYGTAGQATDDSIILRMRIASLITKPTDTHSKYVIIIAFPRQQWLRERVSMLRCTYIASLVYYSLDQIVWTVKWYCWHAVRLVHVECVA
jgi:hypothetical protein